MSKTIRGFHLFTVKEYSRVKAAGNYVYSDTFKVGGYDWQVVFDPHTDDTNATERVGLHLVNGRESVEASFDYILWDQSGKMDHYASGLSHGNLFTKKEKTCIGDFMMDSSDYVKDDSVTFCCMVEVVQSCIRPKKFTIIPSPLEKELQYLLDSEIGSDIVFRVKDETFKAHKAILAARSPVFKAQFYGLIGNPALDEVELVDIEPSVFKAMLLFIYSDKLPESQESTDSMSHMIQHLLVAADRFGLDQLKELCEAKLCEEINVDVVATTLSLAHHHHCSQLKAFCMDFVVANLRAVIQTEAYKEVEKSCPSLVLELLPKIADRFFQRSPKVKE